MVKITDFGVSDVFRMCWEKATHLSKGLCGSEPYIAPEQFEQKEYDARLVDVWAIAIVYYCLNQQELPWRSARSSDETFQAFVQQFDKTASPPPLQALSPRECRAIVKHMLNPSTKQRWYPEMCIRVRWDLLASSDARRIRGFSRSRSLTSTETLSRLRLVLSRQSEALRWVRN